jgi:hypothetical protein
MTNPLQLLKDARALITPENAWTQGANARDANDKQVFARSPDAVSFCMFGALVRADPTFVGDLSPELSAAITCLRFIDEAEVIHFNDWHLYKDAITQFDNAIARLETNDQ